MADTVYWTNWYDSTIRCAPVAGHTNADIIYDSGEGVRGPTGVAIDPSSARIYWANAGDTTIRGAPLAGHGNADILYSGPGPEGVNNPEGVAIDPGTGRIYWANHGDLWTHDYAIRAAPLTGHGSVDTLYGPAEGVAG